MLMLNDIVRAWWTWMWPQLWQSSLLLLLVWGLDALLSRQRIWPQVRLALWTLVAIKLLLPPGSYLSWSATAGVLAAGDVPFLISGVAHVLDKPLPTDILEPALLAGSKAAQAAQAPSWMLLTATLWAIGVAALAATYRLRTAALRSALRRDAEVSPPAWLTGLAHEAAAQLGLRRVPELIITQRFDCPAIFGALRPLVLVPRSMLALSHVQIRHVLLHELAHVRRGDPAAQLAFLLLQIVYWFNPLLILARRRMYELRELCCDATVARTLRERTREYRSTLAAAARSMTRRSTALDFESVGAIGLFERKASIALRLQALERPAYGRAGLRQAVAAMTLLIAATLLLPMGRAADPVCPIQCHGRADSPADAEHGAAGAGSAANLAPFETGQNDAAAERACGAPRNWEFADRCAARGLRPSVAACRFAEPVRAKRLAGNEIPRLVA